ncbi:MAG: hypothetical protein Kow0090_08890 [Myxococcota bacterium]
MIPTLQLIVALSFLAISLVGVVVGVAVQLRERPSFKALEERLKEERSEAKEKFATREELMRIEIYLKTRSTEINELKTLIHKFIVDRIE